MSYDFSIHEYIESLSCGTPIITSGWGPGQEIVKDKINGFTCNTIQEFLNAIDNIDIIDNKTCHEHVQEVYNHKSIRNKYIEFFSFVNNVMTGGGFYHGI